MLGQSSIAAAVFDLQTNKINSYIPIVTVIIDFLNTHISKKE